MTPNLDKLVNASQIHHVGDIEFPSGRILVADPGTTEFASYPALEQQVGEGPFPLHISLSASVNGRDISACWIRFSKNPVHHWHPAFYEGHEPDDHYEPGFGVDTGTACIADAESAATLDGDNESTHLFDLILSEMKSGWVAVFHPDAPTTFFACTSGIGDGYYSSYWGTDSNQEPVYLVVDFQLEDQPRIFGDEHYEPEKAKASWLKNIIAKLRSSG